MKENAVEVRRERERERERERVVEKIVDLGEQAG
jgi:hypothetical protein